jgi:UDP-3-O-[3-hydroxymyristoyl] glucosamine N-acyltransferase
VTHDGFVEIGKNCVIGANSIIGQGFWKRPTLVERNTKIDHLVGISHGSSIGESNLIAAGAILSGSVKTGRNVWIGPGSRITNGVIIGDDSKVGIGSVVIRDVDPKTTVFGVPARTF